MVKGDNVRGKGAAGERRSNEERAEWTETGVPERKHEKSQTLASISAYLLL